MEIFIITVITLLSIICILLGIILGFHIKKSEQTKSEAGKAASEETEQPIESEIVPKDPFPLTTALDQKNSLEIKRSIRDSASPLLLNPTGGLHATKLRAKDTWFRF
jgi:hypothetical protein